MAGGGQLRGNIPQRPLAAVDSVARQLLRQRQHGGIALLIPFAPPAFPGLLYLTSKKSVRAAARGTADVTANIGDAARGADETGQTSGRMFESPQALTAESLRLKTEVNKFLAGVRGA